MSVLHINVLRRTSESSVAIGSGGDRAARLFSAAVRPFACELGTDNRGLGTCYMSTASSHHARTMFSRLLALSGDGRRRAPATAGNGTGRSLCEEGSARKDSNTKGGTDE